jgi:hypothetical protein
MHQKGYDMHDRSKTHGKVTEILTSPCTSGLTKAAQIIFGNIQL